MLGTQRPLSPDTQATLLLCGHFKGSAASHRPLTTGEYNDLAKELLGCGLRPADLLLRDGRSSSLSSISVERLEYLLRRGTAMAL